eukprot:TRINITY_DN26066_c0_g1_i1.p2 TRINITY_DN26066_c0_g1~~TRINITY_DN26066_c0_g1_i1.p2  ORF type:complete len:217 (-),score=64.94 TRINITY_DN26066_c0_g1_i1:168-818(-)
MSLFVASPKLPLVATKKQLVIKRASSVVVRAQAPKLQDKRNEGVELMSVLKPGMAVAVTNILLSLPAHAEAGKLFDFNLTLPIMAGQFLLLMIWLDKFWFGPVGKVLDERDELIRSKLASVKDNSEELRKLQEEAEKILKDARSEVQTKIADAKAKVQAEQAEKLAAAKAQVDKELEVALAQLDKERDLAMANLEQQVEKLSAQILKRVLPSGVKV